MEQPKLFKWYPGLSGKMPNWIRQSVGQTQVSQGANAVEVCQYPTELVLI
jgi:hypothetical protein